MSNSQTGTQQNVLMALQAAQAKDGYLTPEAMNGLAAELGIPVNDVYAVATFYSFLSPRKMGRNVIRICKSLPCRMKDADVVIGTIAEELGIQPGQTTPDGRFSFEVTNCIGLCDGAPAMLVNGDPHVDLTPAKIKTILKDYT